MAEDEVLDDELEQGEDEGIDLVTLTDDNGEDIEFEILDELTHEGKNYVVLLPTDADEDESAEVLILEVRPAEDSEEEEEFLTLDDEELLDKLFDLFCDRHADEFDFEK